VYVAVVGGGETADADIRIPPAHLPPSRRRRSHVVTRDGFNVSVVQKQTLSLESDVETTLQVLDAQDGPVLLIGHSYGGVPDQRGRRHEGIAGLVYLAAFASDAGQSVNALIADPPPARRCRRSCRPSRASCSRIGGSSRPRSTPTCRSTTRH
jgi:pimeloyl-ACP methyl ester carboxylesterase